VGRPGKLQKAGAGMLRRKRARIDQSSPPWPAQSHQQQCDGESGHKPRRLGPSRAHAAHRRTFRNRPSTSAIGTWPVGAGTAENLGSRAAESALRFTGFLFQPGGTFEVRAAGSVAAGTVATRPAFGSPAADPIELRTFVLLRVE